MDHVEHIPLLLRTEDPLYLNNDFFLNANQSGFDPRYFSSSIIILLKQVLPLPFVYFLLTFLVNGIIGWASFWATQFFFNNSEWAGRLAALVVLSVPMVELGSTLALHAVYFTPNILAFAVVLLAFNAIIRQKWLQAGLLLGITALLHPLVGPECGLLFFGLAFLQLFAQQRFQLKRYRTFSLGFALFAALAAINLVPYFLGAGEKLSDEQFFELYVHFRAPHHTLPSYFLTDIEQKNGWYLLALFGFSWLAWWRLIPQQRKSQWLSFILGLSLLILAFVGYVFVEIYPIRLIATAQTWRLLYLFKWMALILAAGFIGHQLNRGTHQNRIYAFLAMISTFTWTNLVRIQLLWFFDRTLKRYIHLPKNWGLLLILPMTALAAYGLWVGWGTRNSYADIYLWGGLLLTTILPPLAGLSKWLQYGLWLLCSLTLTLYWANTPRQPNTSKLQQAISRQYSFEDLPADLLDISKAIKKHTPQAATLVAPPTLAELRFTARRALAANFKTYPFKGPAMLEWRQRLFDIYTWTDRKGFDAAQWAFEPNFKEIKKERLEVAHNKYGADFAILYTKTATSYTVLYQNNSYKLVDIRNK